MNKKSFMDKLDDETLAEMIDITLNYEKTKKNKKMKINLFKLIPAVAAIVCVIGLVNILAVLHIFNGGNEVDGDVGAGPAARPNIAVTDTTSDMPNASNEIKTVNSDDTVITQIGELLIETPKGQEPIENNDIDNTLTLPGGGTFYKKYDLPAELCYKNSQEVKVTVSNGTVIRNDGSINFSPDNPGKTMIYEYDNGEIDVYVVDEDGNVTINGVDFLKYLFRNEAENFNENLPYEDSFNTISRLDSAMTFWGDISYVNDNNIIYELTDKVKITVSFACPAVDVEYDGSYGYIVFYSKFMIEYTNGLTVNAPEKTKVEYDNDKYSFIIGNGDATIIKSDGTESIITAGTVLDDEGNIIK